MFVGCLRSKSSWWILLRCTKAKLQQQQKKLTYKPDCISVLAALTTPGHFSFDLSQQQSVSTHKSVTHSMSLYVLYCLKFPGDQQFIKYSSQPIWHRHPCHDQSHRYRTFSSFWYLIRTLAETLDPVCGFIRRERLLTQCWQNLRVWTAHRKPLLDLWRYRLLPQSLLTHSGLIKDSCEPARLWILFLYELRFVCGPFFCETCYLFERCATVIPT